MLFCNESSSPTFISMEFILKDSTFIVIVYRRFEISIDVSSNSNNAYSFNCTYL